MALLNYTTQIPVEKTIAEIEKMLAEGGANKILKEYDNDGHIESIAFKLLTSKGELPFKLPMNVEAVMARYPRSYKSMLGEDFKYLEVKPASQTQTIKTIECFLYQCGEGDIDKRELFIALDAYKNALGMKVVKATQAYDLSDWA